MLRVIVRQARPGMVLARSVINPLHPDEVFFTPGCELDSQKIIQLHALGVYDLWVDCPGLEFLDDLHSPDMAPQQQRLCDLFRTSLVDQTLRSDSKTSGGKYRATVEEMVRGILQAAAAAPLAAVLGQLDDALLRHGCEVCVLGAMLGLHLESYLVEQRKLVPGKDAREVVNLGIGCLLHDAGELQMEDAHRESRHPLAFDEDLGEQWKAHAELGFAAMRGLLEPSAAAIVLNHHQHFDGTGFPKANKSALGQFGSQIHVFSRIATVADTYAHLLHREGIAQPTVCALWEMQQNPMRRRFDPVVLSALLEVCPPFMPGMLVTLSDRRQAVVTKVRSDSPCYPEVQVLSNFDRLGSATASPPPELIDLSVTPEFTVMEVDGFEVTPYLYGPRRAEGLRHATPHIEQPEIPLMRAAG